MKSRSRKIWVRLIREKPLGLLAVFADAIAPYGYAQTDLLHRFRGSSAEHWLGTDQLGRDLLSRIIYGMRVSLTVSLGAVALGTLVATLIGVTSAFMGGSYDLAVQRGVDAWMAFPGSLLLLTIMSLLGPGLLNITAVLGVSFGIQNSRVIRGAALSVKENTYIYRGGGGLRQRCAADHATAHAPQCHGDHRCGGHDWVGQFNLN